MESELCDGELNQLEGLLQKVSPTPLLITDTVTILVERYSAKTLDNDRKSHV